MSPVATTPAPRWRYVISLILVVSVLAAGIFASVVLASLKQPASLREPVARSYNVEVFRVEKTNLQEIVLAFGTAEADKQVVIGAQVAGEVLEVHPRLKIGSAVHSANAGVTSEGASVHSPGDVLVVIDPRGYEERVVQVESRIAESRAELARVEQEERNLERLHAQLQKDLHDLKQELDKVSDLAQKKIATDSDFRRAQIELRGVETQMLQNENERDLAPARREQVIRRIATLQNDLTLAKLDRDRATVYPPFDGRLVSVSVEQGQYVRPGDPLVTVADPTLVVVPLSVSLDDYAKLAPAVQSGRLPLVALAENETSPPRWHGQLVRVSPQADERTRTVTIFVQVDNREHESPLLPGMFVQARIEGPKLSQVLPVPRDAVLNSRGFLLRDGQAHRVDVKIQRTLQTLVLVDSGLTEGDQVILSNLDVLYDGAPVELIATHTLSEELQRQVAPAARIVP